jgi:hypothetical protein
LLKLLKIKFSPVSHYSIPLGSTYSPQHPVLKDFQPMGDNKFNTDTKLRQNYSFVYVYINLKVSESRREGKMF